MVLCRLHLLQGGVVEKWMQIRFLEHRSYFDSTMSLLLRINPYEVY